MRWRKVQATGLWVAAALGAGLTALGAGCGLTPYNCADYSECPPEGGACPGECVPLPPLEFNGPALLWIGRESEAPACPDRAPRQVYEGHGELDTSYQCAPCACSEPACVLPSVTASDAAGCQGPTFTQLDAPAAWDGSCTSPGAATAPRSVLIDPVSVRPCAPVLPPMPQNNYPPSPWGTFARACAGEAITGVCGDPGLTCLPTAEPPPPGFQQCIMYIGEDDPKCPTEFPEEHRFYGDLQDDRSCTPCACTETAPSNCAGWLSLYQGLTCDPGSLTLTTMIDQAPMPLCLQVAASVQQVRSMEAQWTANDPGACVASGGEPVGAATPLRPRTFCCQPPPG